MSLRCLARIVLLSLSLIALPGPGRAEMIGFSYAWRITDYSFIGPSTPGVTVNASPDGNSYAVGLPYGTVTITPTAGTTQATVLATEPTASPTYFQMATFNFPSRLPSSYTEFTLRFTLHLAITDSASGESAELSTPMLYYGRLRGTPDDLDDLLANTRLNARLVAGGHRFDVQSLGLFSRGFAQGQESFTPTEVAVYVDRLHTAPEPASLLLAGACLALLGGPLLVRRHQHGT